MDFKNILNEIEQATPEVYHEVNGRREVLKSFGSKVALAALPLGIGSLFQKASAKTTAESVPDALNFALQMEYFAYNFYHTGNNTGGLIPAGDQPGFLTIENQKKAHINFLNSLLPAYGVPTFVPKNYNPGAKNPFYIDTGTYDFTASGKYQTFSDYPTFAILAQVFEDMLVHGYQGEIANVLGNADALGQMMRLQTANARHAAHVRFVRRQLGYTVAPEHPAPWISNNIPPIVDFQTYYNSEENIGQENIDITSFAGVAGSVPMKSATAAFDEPFASAAIGSFMAPFLVP